MEHIIIYGYTKAGRMVSTLILKLDAEWLKLDVPVGTLDDAEHVLFSIFDAFYHIQEF